jgi:hypothetical protein
MRRSAISFVHVSCTKLALHSQTRKLAEHGGIRTQCFVQGLSPIGNVEEITTALSRIRWFFVIARNSNLALQGPHGCCEAGWPRIGRSLCAATQCAQGGRSCASLRSRRDGNRRS